MDNFTAIFVFPTETSVENIFRTETSVENIFRTETSAENIFHTETSVENIFHIDISCYLATYVQFFENQRKLKIFFLELGGIDPGTAALAIQHAATTAIDMRYQKGQNLDISTPYEFFFCNFFFANCGSRGVSK